jgi:hypothetical protein
MMIYYQLISNSPTEEEIERVLEKRPEGLSMSQKEQQPLFKEIKRQQKTVDVKSAETDSVIPMQPIEEEQQHQQISVKKEELSQDLSPPSESTTTISGSADRKMVITMITLSIFLNELPQQWIGKEMKMQIIADIMDAAWIARRVLEDVERGLINAQFTVKESDHLCDMTFVLRISEGLAGFRTAVTAIIPVLSFPLTDIKSKAIFLF